MGASALGPAFLPTGIEGWGLTREGAKAHKFAQFHRHVQG